LSSVRVVGFNLQHGHYSNQATPNLQHNELRTRRPMW